MKVAVAYSPGPREVDLTEIDLPEGASVAEALSASGLMSRHAALAGRPLRVGVWGKACSLDKPLREGDRVEVYRALAVDPKEARRRRGALQGRRPAARR
jgi:putative ubiquitin-RnfH superfamily antitoxin RatB of RatAB toxin-antitoxin module